MARRKEGLRKRALYETWLLVLLTLVLLFPWHYDVSISRIIVAKSLKVGKGCPELAQGCNALEGMST